MAGKKSITIYQLNLKLTYENIMKTNINKIDALQNLYSTKRLNVYSITLDFLGFCLFIFYLWNNNFMLAIGFWVAIRLISFIVSLTSNSKFLYHPTHIGTDETTESIFLLCKSVASLLLYYGVWVHTYEIIFMGINLLLIIYLISWIKYIYSDL